VNRAIVRPLTAVASVIAVLLVALAATPGVLPPEHSVVATQGLLARVA
jgi:hypothetical protein